MTLARGTVPAGSGSRFVVAGLLGAVMDALLFLWLTSEGAGLALAHILSFLPAAAVNYSVLAKRVSSARHDDGTRWPQLGRFTLISVLALSIRGGVLALLGHIWHVTPFMAIVPAIAVTAVILHLGSSFYVRSPAPDSASPYVRWPLAAFAIVSFAVLLRLVYIGTAQLIPDEAYYWNYANHMDLSFFDHPPMVAWLIWLGTSIFGNNEFGVRISAIACGLIAMMYLYALACNLYDKSTGIRAVLLFAVLPFGFFTAALMTPDPPLMAAWAATLYYMERALIADRRGAFLGMGLAFGLGILSKYTLGLLGLAALVFVILDPASRRWLRRPHAYLAAALALLMFSPVIIWNVENGWASILFQSQRATGIGNQFSLHLLFLHMLLMLTPVGLLAAVLALWPGRDHDPSPYASRRQLFVRVFTGVPLAVFFGLSLLGSPKFHWTAPVWLALLPAMAWMMGLATGNWRNVTNRVAAAWKPTITVCLVLYAVALHYVVLGVPGIPYKGFTEHYFWREATPEIEQLAKEIQRQTGQKPIVVGMSKWSVSAALSFYGNRSDPMDIRARNMFHQSAAAYDFWYPSEPATKRPILLVGMKPHQVEHDVHGVDNITPSLVEPGPTQELIIYKDGRPLRRVYYRVAHGYNPV
jgi:dolichol-phosphate mannosyltransferase